MADDDILKKIWPEWNVVKMLGKGSFGAVYEAVRKDAILESRAAVKVISIPQNESEISSLKSEGYSDQDTRIYLENIVNDFSTEIRLMESFKGVPNIVSVEDYKVVERTESIGWDIYIRMELLTSFTDYLSGKILSEKEVIKLGCDMCSALEYCAKKDVIHRDIKPENIFVNEFGDFKLGDFGIARKLENISGGMSQKGTYNYMAPEVERGRYYDAKADQYSLGIVLYRLMNRNRLPFMSTDSQILNPNDRAGAIRKRLDGVPLPAPCDASPAMANIILTACAWDPRRRFASPTAMKEALLKLENGSCNVSEKGNQNRTGQRANAAGTQYVLPSNVSENRNTGAGFAPVNRSVNLGSNTGSGNARRTGSSSYSYEENIRSAQNTADQRNENTDPRKQFPWKYAVIAAAVLCIVLIGAVIGGIIKSRRASAEEESAVTAESCSSVQNSYVSIPSEAPAADPSSSDIEASYEIPGFITIPGFSRKIESDGTSSADNGSAQADSTEIGGSEASSFESADGGSASGGTAVTEGNAQAASQEFIGTGEIRIWVSETAAQVTADQLMEYLIANPRYAGYDYKIETVGEDNVSRILLADASLGADIFAFPQDPVSRMASLGVLDPVAEEYLSSVRENNDEGSVNALTIGNTLYAYPFTSDNGYFLYYDKSVISDPGSLETILRDCEKAGKSFCMEINSGWYQTSFFFATGAKVAYSSDANGNFTGCDINYASAAGVTALREMIDLCGSSAFVCGSSAQASDHIGALVSGTWESNAMKEKLGGNYACVKLPRFTGSDGNTYQMGGFGGFKAFGVKPQTDAARRETCHAIANYLSGEEVQLARFEACGWGPSNRNAQQSEAVRSNEALAALAEQLKYSVPMGDYPSDYWNLAVALGEKVMRGEISASMTDDELLAELTKFQSGCISCVQ